MADTMSTMSDSSNSMSGTTKRPRFVLSVDYGTTYTGVAWIMDQDRALGPRLDDIHVVQHWPGEHGSAHKVPSVFTYSASSGQDWGYGIGNSAYVIRWTKLRLEEPSRLDALKIFKSTLRESDKLQFGPHKPHTEVPRHIIRTPADVVNDYLKEVLYETRRDIERQIDPRILRQLPMDVIITHPAVCDTRAKSTTFKAVLNAMNATFRGINYIPGQIRLTTEPEASARYIIRWAEEHQGGTDSLRVGEGLMIVDAGGGTVDLATYRIDQLSPRFQITRVTPPMGGHYGANLIDKTFLSEFLPQRLDPEAYAKLVDFGGTQEIYGSAMHEFWELSPGERVLLDRFQPIKHNFSGRSADNRFRYPLNLPRNIKYAGRDGALVINSDDLEYMFKPSVDGIKSLIEKQLVVADIQRIKVRTVFLSGGFSQSQYLFRRIHEITDSYRCQLVRSDNSWSAVARGAVLMGLGIDSELPPAAIPCPYHLGVIVSKQLGPYDLQSNHLYKDYFDSTFRVSQQVEWFLSKGDMITSEQPGTKTVRLVRKLLPGGSQAGEVVIIVSAADEDPESDNSRQELKISFDLAATAQDKIRDAIEMVTDPKTQRKYQRLELKLETNVGPAGVNIALLGGKSTPGHDILLGTCEPITFRSTGSGA
ncbi:hypothetical protein QBC38DRAFT_482384 [Podospora fimiseda]|uniref:Uncharacterized protein n=1 Tax=Podospora fimiseda TaxID=252190 RepID=A0AAN7GZB6_9PEZI|nr:hypothetical protein QBC38DRAFT_482384 [Podospora fimiseda]